jgi:hypothetical protein
MNWVLAKRILRFPSPGEAANMTAFLPRLIIRLISGSNLWFIPPAELIQLSRTCCPEMIASHLDPTLKAALSFT